MSSASSDTRKRWNAYQRAVSRANVLGRESDELYARWDAAATKAQEAREAASAAHDAYLKSLREAAVVAAAENVLLDIPHAGLAG
jgi:hypothetical protein